jgi:hypothetical protein
MVLSRHGEKVNCDNYSLSCSRAMTLGGRLRPFVWIMRESRHTGIFPQLRVKKGGEIMCWFVNKIREARDVDASVFHEQVFS